MRFCPRCGKKGIKGDFCSECYQKELGLKFKDIEAWKCENCGRYFINNKWKEVASDEAGIIETALSKIKNPKKIPLKITPIYKEIQNKPGLKNPIEIEVKAEGQEFLLPGNVFVKSCPRCSKKGTKYYEGVVQLRNITPDLENFVRQDLAGAEYQGVHIAKQAKKKDSWDIWLTSKKYMRQLGKKLKENFNGELVESAKLFTRNKQTSKDVYRLNILFRQRKFKVGDIITYRGKKIRIKTVGKRASGIDIDTGKKQFVE